MAELPQPELLSTLEYLAEVSLQLAPLLDVNEVCAAIERLVVPKLGDECIVQRESGDSEPRVSKRRSGEDLTWQEVPLAVNGRLLARLIVKRRNAALDIELLNTFAHRAAIALDNAQRYALARQAVEAREHSVASVCHDLRNPLTAVLLKARLLLRPSGKERRREATEAVESILQAARQMKHLISTLADSVSTDSPGSARAVPVGPAPHSANRVVLVVDDDPDTLETIGAILQHVGYRVVTKHNGQQALDYLRHAPAPALVLLDLEMPVMNGRAFLNEQRTDPRLRAIPVVVISGAPSEAAFEGQYLRKPLEVDRLLKTVDRLTH